MCKYCKIFALVIASCNWFIPASANAEFTSKETVFDAIHSKYISQAKHSEIEKLQFAEILALANFPSSHTHATISKKQLPALLSLIFKDNKAGLSQRQLRRAAVLGILVSIDKQTELKFASLLANYDAANGLSSICKLKWQLHERDWDGAKKSITGFLASEYVDYYEDTGAKLRFDLFVDYFGNGDEMLDFFDDFSNFPKLSLSKVISHVSTIREYNLCSGKCFRDNLEFELPIDQLYLFRAKRGKQVLRWLYQINLIQRELLREIEIDGGSGNSELSFQARYKVLILKQSDSFETIGKAFNQASDELLEISKDNMIFRKLKSELLNDNPKLTKEDRKYITALVIDEKGEKEGIKKLNDIRRMIAEGNEWDACNSLGKLKIVGIPANLADITLGKSFQEERLLLKSEIDR